MPAEASSAISLDQTYHYPPELMEMLIKAIPCLVKGKQALIDFFQGAGMPAPFLVDWQAKVRADRDSVKKNEIARGCSAPSVSSHVLKLQRAKLLRAAIAEGLVWPFGVVPLNPLSNGGTGFSEAGEVMLPDAFLFEAAKETLDEAILLRRIGRDELLAQAVIAAGSAKTRALKNQSIVRAHHRVVS